MAGHKEEDDDDDNSSINGQPNNEGEKAKGGWVLCNFFFLDFVLWWVLVCPLHFCQA
jgi:hypothetical protein